MTRAATLEGVDTPRAYAARLAKYISDPSTIRVRTLEHWGRAPTVTECANLRSAAVREKTKFRDECEARATVTRDRITGDTFLCGHERSAENTYFVGNRDECRICLAKRQDNVRLAFVRQKAVALRNSTPAPKWRMVDEYARQASIAAVTALPAVSKAARIKHPYRRVLVRSSELSGVPLSDIVSPKRKRAIVRARWSVMHVLDLMGLSSPRIAAQVGLKDHTTALYALDNIAAQRIRDPEFDWLCDELEKFAGVGAGDARQAA